jgi:predicted GIY-YIG superfamily endonuclease
MPATIVLPDMRNYYVYIMSNSRRTVLYIGITNNLERRVTEHRTHMNRGFTDTYNCTELIYSEVTSNVTDAIAREKQLKRWSRTKKFVLIKGLNPELRDLSTPA